MKPLGLYLHIPFCRSKCAYCDFYSLPGCTEAAMDAYTDALCTHLARFAPEAAGYTADTVYFGGGTPSLLGARRLLAVWDAVARNYRLSDDPEVTLEANPESAGDWFRSLREAGFNRVSLGMQSASDAELRAVGRVHAHADTVRAVEAVRRAGFQNLSLDLIYGLPGQTADSWRRSVRAALALGPEHLSIYGLKTEAGTPLYARRDGLPDDTAQAAAYLWAAAELARRGWEHYEISNFARPGYASRHNRKYWTLREYAGFGPGAHSDFGGARYAFPRDLAVYLEGVRIGRVPYAERTAVSDGERAREWVMLAPRTSEGLDPAAYTARFGRDFGVFRPFLAQCEQAGYGRWHGGRFALTPRGFLVSNAVIVELLERLEAEWDRQP